MMDVDGSIILKFIIIIISFESLLREIQNKVFMLLLYTIHIRTYILFSVMDYGVTLFLKELKVDC